ncbi:MAG: hemolysin family protein [Candidatus Acetothermia bacterium]|jgi:putative hemolysin|nr:hemolysin family protein [Candidatus Acetothermia bacterium]MDH7504827.1 hemolysin family protein [Candidatus Acetothermia bacterium]
MNLIWGFVALLVLVLFSGFLSASETALTAMGRGRLGYLVKAHPRKARALKALLNDPNGLITALLIANNFVNLLASSIATILSLQLLRPYLSTTAAGLVATILITLYLLALGEITPKSLAKNHPERFTLAAIWPVYLLAHLLRPLVLLFRRLAAALTALLPASFQGKEQPGVSEEQIKYLIEASRERGLLEKEDVEMIKRIFTYDDMTAEQVMVPRPDVQAIEINTPLEEAKRIMAQDRHSRFPAYEGDRDNVIGFLYAKDLLQARPGQSLRELLRPPFYTSTTRPINELLRDFQREHQHMAMVVDEFGGMAGIVTLEDILEEIVGEIEDEYDRPEQLIQRLSANEYLVDGDTEVDLLNEKLGLALPLDEGVTISGLLLARFEDIPEEGESVEIDSVRLTVEEASEREILKVRLELLPGQGAGDRS